MRIESLEGREGRRQRERVRERGLAEWIKGHIDRGRETER